MELLYPDMFMQQSQLDYEYYYFVTNYIVGEKINIHSTMGYFLYVVKNIKKLNNSQLVDIFENLFLITHFRREYQPIEVFHEIDIMRINIKTIISFKKIKHLPKRELEYLQQFNQSMKTLRESIYDELSRYLKLSHIDVYLDLIDEDIIKIKYSTLNRNFNINDDEIGELLFHNFIKKEKLLVLENFLDIEKAKEELINIEGVKKGSDIGYDIIVSKLIELPCQKDLPLSDLIILRSQYQTKFTKLLQKVQEFRLDLRNEKFDESSKQKFVDFEETIIEDFNLLQSEIDANIYFQKIRNSDEDYINVRIKFVLLPINYILAFYNYKCVLTTGKVLELQNRLDNEIGIEACELCVFYDIEPKINKLER